MVAAEPVISTTNGRGRSGPPAVRSLTETSTLTSAPSPGSSLTDAGWSRNTNTSPASNARIARSSARLPWLRIWSVDRAPDSPTSSVGCSSPASASKGRISTVVSSVARTVESCSLHTRAPTGQRLARALGDRGGWTVTVNRPELGGVPPLTCSAAPGGKRSRVGGATVDHAGSRPRIRQRYRSTTVPMLWTCTVNVTDDPGATRRSFPWTSSASVPITCPCVQSTDGGRQESSGRRSRP